MLLVPLAIVLVAGLFVPLLTAVLRIGGSPRVVIDYASTGAVYLGAAWLAIVVCGRLGETIVASEHLTTRSLDSQLIRLGTRLIGLVAAIAILIQGGDELGFPAYSVLAGLGVGGLAVALAAQSTIANLIGSLLITMEKPFSVGHVRPDRRQRRHCRGCRLPQHPHPNAGQFAGDDPQQHGGEHDRRESQPADQAPATILRAGHLQHAAREAGGTGCSASGNCIVDHPLAEDSTCQVRFNNFAESSLDILVIFHLHGRGSTPAELARAGGRASADHGSRQGRRRGVRLPDTDAVHRARTGRTGGPSGCRCDGSSAHLARP